MGEKNAIWKLFDEQYLSTPDRTALYFNNEEFTYHWIYKEVKRMESMLSHGGVNPHEVVVLCLTRTPYLFSCLLACVAFNAVFLLLEPSQPIARLNEMLSLVRPALVLHDSALNTQQLSAHKLVNIFDSLSSISLHRMSLCKLKCSESDIMYIIFTSGSTGRPKPILASTSGTLNRFQWMWNAYPFSKHDKLCFKTSVHFVDCIWELLGGLLQGIPTLIVNSDDLTNPDQFLSLINYHSITRLSLVPSYLSLLLSVSEMISHLNSLQILVSGGETLSLSLAEQFLSKVPQCRLINIYGCSEVCADVTFFEVTVTGIEELRLEPHPPSSVPIGWPILNINTHIRQSKDTEEGIGELVISGVGVANGYLHNDKTTSDKFSFGESKTFKTGDLVRRLSTGALVCLGRIDDQIKVRGIRIEPCEVEGALLQCIGSVVERALVCGYEKQNTLVAFIQTSSRISSVPVKYKDHSYFLDDDLTAQIKGSLKDTLPSYLLPSLFIFTHILPTLSSGKIDKRALPFPSEILQTGYNKSEKSDSVLVNKVCDIFSNLLGDKNITCNSNFFHLGGHSLLAVHLVQHIKLLGYSIPYSAVFTCQTVGSLVEYIIEQGHSVTPDTNIALKHVQKGPLSYQQYGIWIDHTRFPFNPQYNLELAYVSTQSLSIDRLKECVYHIVSQHEALRTVFTITEQGKPQQEVLEWDSPMLQAWLPKLVIVKDSSSLIWSNGEVILPNMVFDTKTGPLFKFLVFNNINIDDVSGCTIIALQIHHIITDGWSNKKMLEQLESMYVSGISSSCPNTTVLSYSIHQRNSINSEHLCKDRLSYWRKNLQGIPLRSSIPHDKIGRPVVLNDTGSARKYFNIPNLSQFCLKYQVTEFMVLLATLKIILHIVGSSDDITVAVVENNRSDSDISDTLGLFINTLLLQSDLSTLTTFSTFLSQIRQTVLDGLDNSLPFEYVEEQLNLKIDPYSSCSYQVMMVYEHKEEQPFLSSSLFRTIPVQANGHECDLDIYVTSCMTRNKLSVEIKYAPQLYYSTTIHNFIELWNGVLQRVTQDANVYLPSILGNSLASSNPVTTVNIPVEITGDGIAIVTSNESITWSMISSLSRSIQHYMTKNKVSNQEVISVQLDSVAMSAAVGVAAILCGLGVVFTENSTTSVDTLLHIVENVQSADLQPNTLSITQLLQAESTHVDHQMHLRDKTHGVIHDSSLQWMSQYDIATVGEFIQKYINGTSSETVHVLATSLNSSQFSLALALLMNHVTIHLHTTLETITHKNIPVFLLPTHLLHAAMDKIHIIQPHILWLHGFPSGLRYIIDNIKKRTYVSHSILPTYYIITHHYEVSSIKHIVCDYSRYLPLGSISSYITWRLVSLDGCPKMAGGVGVFVCTSPEGVEIRSHYLVRQTGLLAEFELISMNFSKESTFDNTLMFTALCRNSDIVWSTLEPDLLRYITTSKLLPPQTLRNYLLKYVFANLIPSVIEQVEHLVGTK